MAAYAALVSVMNIIDALQLHPRPPISLHPKQVESLTEKVNSLEEFLEIYNPQLDYSTEADPLEIRIADSAYAAEDAIESHIVDQIKSDGEKISSDAMYEALEKVIEEMVLIQKEAMEIKQTLDVQHQLQTKSMPSNSLKSSPFTKESRMMVGADDALLEIKDKLTSDRRDLQIIPIVGMGGSGKTTLAINIYQDSLIKEHFVICAWATISQEYSIPEMLVQVLHQLNQNVGQNLSEYELGKILYQHLFGRKYLIVLDDMWSIEAWDGVRRFFPENKNGSRLVVTTRLSNLASNLSNSENLEMSLLNEVDSWELFSKTVFERKGCPPVLEGIGKRIGKSCKGLPLSIVVIGGLLAKSEHTREFWESIEKNLNSILNSEDDERCLKILHMSYKQLPVYLKPCFLYMGVFAEDDVISISKLIKLWVAEGFLKPVSGKSLEEIARVYLMDLISRNLILVHELGKIGNIKQCKIHDLLRDLCLREAQKEKIYIVVKGQDNPQGIVKGQRRVVISKGEDIRDLSMPLARSLMWNVFQSLPSISWSLNQSLPPLSLRLLRILDSPRYQSVVDKINQLVSLRFLAMSTVYPWCEFPSSIWLFWNLQTLMFNEWRTIIAPIDIWYMAHIRHLQCEILELPDPLIGQDEIVLGNLQTLGTVKNFKCSEQVVKRIPNIKKLKVSYDDGIGEDRYSLTNLERLSKLESFECFCYVEVNSLARLINFPRSLKKLTLKLLGYLLDILDKIGALPLLQKLMVYGGSFREGQWVTTEGQFRSLKFLGLYSCKGLQVWTTESSHFPCLHHIVLRGLDELEEIPLELAEISTLRVIEVDSCSNSAMESTKRIVEELEELYGEEAALQVRVTLRMNNKELIEI